MDTPNSAATAVMAGRLISMVFGLLGLGWGASLSPPLWKSAPVEAVARRFIAGETFTPEALAELISTRQPRIHMPLPNTLRADAVLRLSLAEHALVQTDFVAIDARLAETATALDAALEVAPADSYLWLLRFWIADTRLGFSPARLADLAASYEYGPLEGWITLRRNALSMSLFARLDADLQQRVVAEFSSMVASNMVREAGRNLTGPGWLMRERLLASLSNIEETPKRALAKQLRREGYKIDMPGVDDEEGRQWR